MSVSATLSRRAGKNAADALVDGVRNGGRDIRKFVEQIRENPQALVSSNTTSNVGWRDFVLIEVAVALGWWAFVLDGEEQTWTYLDALGIVYVSAVIFGVLR